MIDNIGFPLSAGACWRSKVCLLEALQGAMGKINHCGWMAALLTLSPSGNASSAKQIYT